MKTKQAKIGHCIKFNYEGAATWFKIIAIKNQNTNSAIVKGLNLSLLKHGIKDTMDIFINHAYPSREILDYKTNSNRLEKENKIMDIKTIGEWLDTEIKEQEEFLLEYKADIEDCGFENINTAEDIEIAILKGEWSGTENANYNAGFIAGLKAVLTEINK